MPMARRRCISPQTLERKMTPCGREVVEPRTPESLHPTPPPAPPSSTISIFKSFIWIRRLEAGGIQVRFIFSRPAPDEKVLDVEDGAVLVRVHLPREESIHGNDEDPGPVW